MMRCSSGRSSRFPELITEANVDRLVLRRIQVMHVLYRRPAAARGIEGVDGESTPIHEAAMIVICSTIIAHTWSRWVNERAVADYGKCATSVKIRWTKPERSGERLAVAPSRHDRCHGWPNGVVLAIDEFGGSKDKLSTGVCPAAGVKKTSTK